MRKWQLLLAFFSPLISLSIVLAAFINSQTTTAAVSMATSDDFTLYVCEPGGKAGPECGADDSGADEIIFETDENAAPGSTRYWDIRLRNAGASVAWDLLSFDVTIAPVDPAEDCGVPPVLTSDSVRILGKVIPAEGYSDPTTGTRYDVTDDNHLSGSGAVGGSIGLWTEQDYNFYPTYSGYHQPWVVHIAPGDYEDIRLRVGFPNQGQGNECAGSQWRIEIKWNVAAHQ